MFRPAVNVAVGNNHAEVGIGTKARYYLVDQAGAAEHAIDQLTAPCIAILEMWATLGVQLAHQLVSKQHTRLKKYNEWSDVPTVILKVKDQRVRKALLDHISHMIGCAFGEADEEVERVTYALNRLAHFVPEVSVEEMQNHGNAAVRLQHAEGKEIRDVDRPTSGR